MAPLETRRLRENLTEVFKILKAIEDINSNVWFYKIWNWEYSLKLTKSYARINVWKYSFSGRVVSSTPNVV